MIRWDVSDTLKKKTAFAPLQQAFASKAFDGGVGGLKINLKLELQLKRLLLDGNQITDIAPGAFRSLPVLTTLELQNNMLTSV